MVILLGKRGGLLALALFFMLSGCGVDNSTDPAIEPTPIETSPETGADDEDVGSEEPAPAEEGSDDSSPEEPLPADEPSEPSEPSEFTQTSMIITSERM